MRYVVEQDKEQWLFTWLWRRAGETGVGHGPYPFRWMASLAGWLATR